jgi:hypothetical protein
MKAKKNNKTQYNVFLFRRIQNPTRGVDYKDRTEQHPLDAAPAPGRKNYAAPAPILRFALCSVEFKNYTVHFDAAPAPQRCCITSIPIGPSKFPIWPNIF